MNVIVYPHTNKMVQLILARKLVRALWIMAVISSRLSASFNLFSCIVFAYFILLQI
ncbi:MAG: hypothetical protein FWF52_06500 [Candidatus Azobacteroides sp.]|nr:hypothetical protein [Candidatus Azobacteroides sp.]